MGTPRVGRRRLLTWAGVATVGGGAAAVGFWPGHTERAAYPLAGRIAGSAEPLWSVPPQALARATEEDAKQLARLMLNAMRATAAIERLEPRLTQAAVGDISGADRQRLRGTWWQLFEPLLGLDELKNRYRAWYGVDYLKQPLLHARSFALSFAGLCGQVSLGLRLLAALEKKPLLPVLFDEAMPSMGLPSHTFSRLRHELGRARDLFFVPLGDEWYERWIGPQIANDQAFNSLHRLLEGLRKDARRRVLTPTAAGVANKLATLQSDAFTRWFPLQKDFAEWAGDTRLVQASRKLVSDEQLATFRTKLAPGDVIVERRNWYLSNIGLPGFWPHAALYLGTQREILASLGGVPEVKSAHGDLAHYLSGVAPKAWASLAERDERGHERNVIEAVSEGVVTSSLEYSCAADYVAALRPRVAPLTRVRAIERALRFWGRPYDFNFDFLTDDQLVCSELVVKAYEVNEGEEGLRIPYVELVGRHAVPPTELVRTFKTERDKDDRQLDFVYFLEGRESEHAAAVGDADSLAATCDRPKWDLVQP
jgi:hypothetical protein